MSHTTVIKSVPIRSKNIIEAAVRELQQEGVKCNLVANATPRMYYNNQHGICDLVIKLDDCPYDVGLQLNKETGLYEPVFDKWADHLKKKIGSKDVKDTSEASHIGRFLQLYSKHTIIQEAVMQGYSVESCIETANGELELLVNVN